MKRWLLGALVVCLGCATLPESRGSRGLYVDLRKAVQFHESSGDWVVDRVEVDGMREEVMSSTCRTSRETREDLRMWLDSRIEDEAGAGASGHSQPSALVYAEEGGMSSRVREVQKLERVRMLLDAADDLASECPYWTEPDERFAGIESDEGRVVLLAESVGGGALRLAGSEVSFGGGGGARLMLGLGIRQLTLGLGFGLTAAATFVETEDGARSFEAVFSSEVPLLVRLTNIGRVFDFVVSYRTLFLDSGTRHGAHFEIGYGLTTPRVATLMPYGLLWIGYEIFPSSGSLPMEHAFFLGTRVGFDWDPGAAGR